MSDLDRLLRDAIQGAGRDYRPSDLSGARHTFMRRRRRLQIMRFATAGVVVTAVIVGALVFTGERTTLVDDKPPIPPVDSPDLAKLEGTIPVGDGPSGIAAGAGYIWVANRDEGTVSRIDPATHDVTDYDVGGAPEDLIVADDVVWVSHRERTMWTRIEGEGVISGSESLGAPVGEVVAPPAHVDLDVFEFDCPPGDICKSGVPDGELVVYAAGDPANDELLRESGALPVREMFEGKDPQTLSDVAVSGGMVWVMSPSGQVIRLAPFSAPIVRAIHDIPRTSRGDLVADGDEAWVALSERDEILHLSVTENGEFAETSLRLSGEQIGLALDEESLWAVSTEGPDGPGAVTRIDLSTRQVVESVAIDGNPVDIVVGAGSVWVADALNDAVLRFDTENFVAEPDDAFTETSSPGPSPSADSNAPERLDARDVLFFHSTDGDIYAEFADGSSRLLVEGPDAVRPAFTVWDQQGRGSAQGLMFDRAGVLAFFNLESMKETKLSSLDEKTFVGVSPTGSETYIEPVPPETAISIGGLLSDREQGLHIPPEQQGVPHSVAWDPSGDLVYYVAELNELDQVLYAWRLPQRDRRFDVQQISPLGNPDDGIYVGPSSRDAGTIDALHLCCRANPQDEFEKLELVTIELSVDRLTYEPIAVIDLTESPLFDHLTRGPDTSTPWARIFTAPAGALDLEHSATERHWLQGQERAWFVGDGEALWLVDEAGNVDYVGDLGDGGVAVATP